jgi:hypothetical protein
LFPAHDRRFVVPLIFLYRKNCWTANLFESQIAQTEARLVEARSAEPARAEQKDEIPKQK